MSVYLADAGLNGVSFCNQAGNLKQRYETWEKLALCRADPRDLEEFNGLFCPDMPYYVITQERADDWTDPHHRLTDAIVLTHLLGNTIPERAAKWVAPKCWGATRFVGIDVDFHAGEEEDFRRRCKFVRRALRILGVPKKGIRVDWTPSGGKHYRFFLTHAIKVAQIPEVLAKVGLRECRGQFEIFPRKANGFRLPFGLVPGKTHDPTRWATFIRRYRQGLVPQVNWRYCRRRAENYLSQHPELQAPEPIAQPRLCQQKRVKSRSVREAQHGSLQEHTSQKTADTSAAPIDQYQHLPQKAKRAKVEELWRRGIEAPGTRTKATLILAWHLRFVRRRSFEESIRTLVEWVYRTGKTTSATVKADNAAGTRRVEAQTRSIVEWIAKWPKRPVRVDKTQTHLSKSEVDKLLHLLKFASPADQIELLEFGLEFLRYAKLHGEGDEQGWIVPVAAAKVMRRWRRCSGRMYKIKREKFEAIHVIETVMPEWRTKTRSGRARTYRIRVSSSLATGATMTVSEALQYASNRALSETNGAENTRPSSRPNDTYVKVVENNLTTQIEVGVGGQGTGSLWRDIPSTVSSSHSSGHNRLTGKAEAIASAGELYAATNRKLLELPRKTRVKKAAPRLNDPVIRGPSEAPLALLNLPLDAECREWLLKNNQPGLGIPKKYLLKIEAAREKAIIQEQQTKSDSHLCAGPPRARGFPNHDPNSREVTRHACRCDRLADGFT